MLSQSRPQLCDRRALMRNRTRVRADAMFLHEEALADVQDRLLMVNKPFQTRAVVTGHSDFWSQAFPDARILVDDDVLDLQPASCDLVIHAMCLHWANDPVGQLIQCRRALKPDGLLLAVLPGGETLTELRSCLGEAETQTRGGLSPRVLPMADLRDLGALLQRAGFALPVADTLTLFAEYDDLPALMRDLRHMGEANALANRDKYHIARGVFHQANQLYRMHFPGNQKALKARFDLITLTGWAPADSQPQPLRPGSAKARLADALGTKESPLHD